MKSRNQILLENKIRRMVRHELLKEESNIKVTVHCINGERFYISKGSFESPKTNASGFIQQLRDLDATPPAGYSSAEHWVHDCQTRDSSISASIKVDPTKFSKYFKGF